MDFENEYKRKIEELRKLLKSAKSFEQGIELALDVHAMTHTSEVSSSGKYSYCDDLLNGLTDEHFCVMPEETDETIAWHLWHIARIEDIVASFLVANKPQLFNDKWQKRMNAAIKDTGNAMSDQEIISFSKSVNKNELLNYRNEVGKRTREILKSLTREDLKRKPEEEYLERIVAEGCLTEEKDSVWLKDFWGRLTVSGRILLPLTRHHMMHLPDSYRIKEFIQNKL